MISVADRGGRSLMPAAPVAPDSGGAAVVRRDVQSRVNEALTWGLLERESCRRSLLYYLENYVWSYDEHEREDPKRKLFHGDHVIDPRSLQMTRPLDGREDDYLRYIALVWEQVPLLLVPKSRQLRLSHLMMAAHGWLGQFFSGQRIAVQSKKLEDADALLERRWMAMQVERENYPHVSWPTARRKKGAIIYDHGSILQACAQGSDVLRSYTFSAILSDEMAFQEEAEDAYTASIPTIEGGGKFTGVSTANPSYFEQLVFDRLAMEV